MGPSVVGLDNNNTTCATVAATYDRSTTLGTQISYYLQRLEAVIPGSAVNWYAMVGTPSSKYGSWGLLETQYQDPTTNHKYQAVADYIAGKRKLVSLDGVLITSPGATVGTIVGFVRRRLPGSTISVSHPVLGGRFNRQRASDHRRGRERVRFGRHRHLLDHRNRRLAELDGNDQPHLHDHGLELLQPERLEHRLPDRGRGRDRSACLGKPRRRLHRREDHHRARRRLFRARSRATPATAASAGRDLDHAWAGLRRSLDPVAPERQRLHQPGARRDRPRMGQRRQPRMGDQRRQEALPPQERRLLVRRRNQRHGGRGPGGRHWRHQRQRRSRGIDPALPAIHAQSTASVLTANLVDGSFAYTKPTGYHDWTGASAFSPVLTSPVGTSTGSTTATVGATTDTGSGTLYYVVTTSATQPTAAQIKAGQNNTGSAAVASGNQAVFDRRQDIQRHRPYRRGHLLRAPRSRTRRASIPISRARRRSPRRRRSRSPRRTPIRPRSFSNGNLTVTLNGANYTGSRTTRGISSGKCFVEFHVDSFGVGLGIGVGDNSAAATLYAAEIGNAGDNHGISFWQDGTYYVGGASFSGAFSFGASSYVGLAIDMTAKKAWLYVNGVLKTTGDPVAGTGGISLAAISGTAFPVPQVTAAASTVTLNAGATAYSFTPPTGYGAIP
jgi:hypothetical protein